MTQRIEKQMDPKEIYITRVDLNRIERMIEILRFQHGKVNGYLEDLVAKLEQGRTVRSRTVPPDVVTMNSRVRLRALDGLRTQTYTLVFPEDRDSRRNRVSIVAPLGAALLGRREQQLVSWHAPTGTRKMVIDKIVYQPEAERDYHL